VNGRVGGEMIVMPIEKIREGLDVSVFVVEAMVQENELRYIAGFGRMGGKRTRK